MSHDFLRFDFLPLDFPPSLLDISKLEWCNYAAKTNDLTSLKWARRHNAPWDYETCALAAANGHLKILKWARSHGAPWDENICTNAAYSGKVEILKWARSHGAIWDEWVCLDSIYNGYVEVLQWAIANGAPLSMESIIDNTSCILNPKFKSVRMQLLRYRRDIPSTNSIIIMCMSEIKLMLSSIPLTSPLCGLIINYL